MKTIAALVVVLLAASSHVVGGEVYGKILEGTKAVGEGTAVEMKCGGKSYPVVTTDKTGSYHLVVSEAGKCTMTLKHKGQAASLEIASYDDPVQIDLVLEVRDGKLSARRK